VQNPWKELAQEERKRVSLYFAAARYELALQELRRLLTHMESGERKFLQAMAQVVEGYRDWDNFRHRDARPKLGQALRFLKPYVLGTRREGLARCVLAVAGGRKAWKNAFSLRIFSSLSVPIPCQMQ
jgi:hypothetical protein